MGGRDAGVRRAPSGRTFWGEAWSLMSTASSAEDEPDPAAASSAAWRGQPQFVRHSAVEPTPADAQAGTRRCVQMHV